MPEWVPLGDRAVRLARPRGASPRALVRVLRAWPDVTDVVVTRDHVAVYFRHAPQVGPADFDVLADVGDAADPPRTMDIAAVYDGPDLPDVARAAGIAEHDVATIHASALYEVETMGFAPGFAYLTGLDPRLHLPRRATPRTRVPAGSIAVAGGYTGIYPFESPGGWHLIGRTDVRLFGADGSLLRLGDRVRFVR